MSPCTVIPYPIVVPLKQLYLIQLLYPSSSPSPSHMPTHMYYLLLLYLVQYSSHKQPIPSPTHAHNFIALAYVVIMYSHPRKPAQPYWDHQTSIFPHQPICLRQHHSSCFIQQQTSRSRTSPSTGKTGYQDWVRSIYWDGGFATWTVGYILLWRRT